MLNRLSLLLLTKLLWLLVAVILIVAWVIALETHDAHWVNRGGALIAALAAGSVLLQIVIEIGLERKRHEIEDVLRIPKPPDDELSPIDRLAKTLAHKGAQRQVEGLERARLLVVLRVVLCAMLGELLHGFGDLAACSLLMSCLEHS